LLRSPLDSMIIAIDGATKDVYENVRKSERFTFEEVQANAEEFLSLRRALGRNKPHVTLSIIVMEETAADLERFVAFWRDHGADEVVCKPFANWGGQYSDVFNDLAVAPTRSMLASPRIHPCKHLWTSLVVTWDGRVVPCCYDYDTKQVLGDLKTQTFAEIWNGPAYVELRRAELEQRNNSELCANCSQAPGHARDRNFTSPLVSEDADSRVLVA
jgi:radical SAM protein with 4Fe4S-binding SPASM domain